MKAESCHIVPGQPRLPHNRLIMNHTLHSWYDGTPQMTSLRRPTLFITLGDGGHFSFPDVPDRVFLPIRLFADEVDMTDVRHEFSRLVPHREIRGDAHLQTVRVDDRTIQVYVGFQRGGRTDDQVRDAVGAALGTRARPDRVGEAVRASSRANASLDPAGGRLGSRPVLDPVGARSHARTAVPRGLPASGCRLSPCARPERILCR